MVFCKEGYNTIIFVVSLLPLLKSLMNYSSQMAEYSKLTLIHSMGCSKNLNFLQNVYSSDRNSLPVHQAFVHLNLIYDKAETHLKVKNLLT